MIFYYEVLYVLPLFSPSHISFNYSYSTVPHYILISSCTFLLVLLFLSFPASLTLFCLSPQSSPSFSFSLSSPLFPSFLSPPYLLPSLLLSLPFFLSHSPFSTFIILLYYQQATCCEDKAHCCPHGYHCSSAGCEKASENSLQLVHLHFTNISETIGEVKVKIDLVLFLHEWCELWVLPLFLYMFFSFLFTKVL